MYERAVTGLRMVWAFLSSKRLHRRGTFRLMRLQGQEQIRFPLGESDVETQRLSNIEIHWSLSMPREEFCMLIILVDIR